MGPGNGWRQGDGGEHRKGPGGAGRPPAGPVWLDDWATFITSSLGLSHRAPPACPFRKCVRAPDSPSQALFEAQGRPQERLSPGPIPALLGGTSYKHSK